MSKREQIQQDPKDQETVKKESKVKDAPKPTAADAKLRIKTLERDPTVAGQ